TSTISAAELQEALSQVRARRIVLMIDACHSTAAFGSFLNQSDFYQRFFADMGRSSGFAVLSAARSSETAIELRTLGHGAFTYVLVQGLGGAADRAPNDSRVMIQELSGYMQTRLPEVTLDYENINQEPGAFALGMDFPVR